MGKRREKKERVGSVPGMSEGPLAALAREGRSNAHFVRLHNTKRKFRQGL